MRQIQVVDAVELAAAYADARYVVALDGDHVGVRVGRPAPDLEAYWPAARYTFLTAWNPASTPRSQTANEAADALLVAELDARGVRRQAAWAESPDGHWREAGWLLADLDRAGCDRLAQAFGQAAVLTWARGEPVRLRMLVERPLTGRLAESVARHVEWVDDAVTA